SARRRWRRCLRYNSFASEHPAFGDGGWLLVIKLASHRAEFQGRDNAMPCSPASTSSSAPSHLRRERFSSRYDGGKDLSLVPASSVAAQSENQPSFYNFTENQTTADGKTVMKLVSKTLSNHRKSASPPHYTILRAQRGPQIPAIPQAH